MAVAWKLRPSGRVAFTHRNFTLFLTARSLIVLALEMQSVAVGWQVYDITKKPLDLGLIGLAQFTPSLILFLLSGHLADRVNRRKLLTMCYLGFAACSALLLAIAWRSPRAVLPIYGAVILSGIVRSFNGPVTRAILPQLVPEEHFTNAVAWSSSANQTANIIGPSIGGFIYAAFRGPSAVYALAMTAGLAAALATLRVQLESGPRPHQPVNVKTVLAGIHYIWRQKIVLGSISLDLFAVLLGGAVALLPVYAREILHTGPWGLGLLRCSPGIGAASMALFLAHRPLKGRSGITMLWCVAGFGFFTILFGLSHHLILSMIALVMVGATDMVSVMVRAILVQLATPDQMRGRVNAVDMIFIGASNELGQFESGLTAAWFGTVPAVVLGGIGTLVVTALWAWGFPELRTATSRALNT
ncbi:MAG: MFS transporter [Candidatus Acidiferrales bacterium]|jgi:MFS family permease